MSKQYGLIKVDAKTKAIARPSIFNEDSDSDNASKPTGITTLKKKERTAQEKAVAEDPTIYQYDELYDDMESKRIESKMARKDLDKKPKYISKLLESADRRKRENEKRIEKQVQKEREAEGDMYKDKESFVTSAYRAKLEEIKELEEKEKREEYLEEIGDVKKQKDLSGFYRHLYAQQVNYDEEAKKNEDKKDEKSEHSEQTSSQVKKTGKRVDSSEEDINVKKDDKSSKSVKVSRRSSTSSIDDSEAAKLKLKKDKIDEKFSKKKSHRRSSTSSTDEDETSKTTKKEDISSKKKEDSPVKLDKQKRKYRKRDSSSSGSEIEEKKKLAHLQSNLDADSDFSIDSESDSETETKKQKVEDIVVKEETTGEKNGDDAKTCDKVEVPNEDKIKEDDIKPEVKIEEKPKPKKPKVDIWKKRTVGVVFDDALKRFYERKASKAIQV